jgi:PadR family transcriptional regulator, regulatory protein PadR
VEDVRLTVAVATVLRVFLDDVAGSRYGYELMQLTGYPSGKLYPILARLEAAGWLDRQWEQIDPSVERRPARCLYRFSKEGAARARNELALLHQQLAPRPRGRRLLRPDGGRA